MKMIKLRICEMFIRYYSKRWREAIDGMNKHMSNGVTPEFRKYAELNTKYGQKTLDWMNKKGDILKELGLSED